MCDDGSDYVHIDKMIHVMFLLFIVNCVTDISRHVRAFNRCKFAA